MLKMMIVGRRRGGMTVAQLHHYMTDVHGAQVVACIATDPELTPQRYVQNHVFDSSFRVPSATPDPFATARDFVTQVWFNDPAQAAASLQAPFYKEVLQPDEDRFVDQPSVVKLPVVPQVLHNTDLSTGDYKLFVLHQCAADVSLDTLQEATLALWRPLLASTTHGSPGTHGIDAVVRNRVMQRPGAAPATVDLVDEVWLSSEAATRALAAHWQAATEAAPLQALLMPGSSVVLLAHERVMFAGHR